MSQSRFLKAVREDVARPPNTNLFICAFSERPDAMSQWDRYAAHGYGYSLGFDKRKIDRAIADSHLELRQVLYTRARQRAAIERRINQFVGEFRAALKAKPSRSTDSYLKLFATVAAIDLEDLTLELKNPDFRDEKEWRLIREIRSRDLASQDESISFAPRGDLVKPYIEITLGDEMYAGKPLLPIAAVVCGPKLPADAAAAAAAYFLQCSGYQIPVRHSSLKNVWR